MKRPVLMLCALAVFSAIDIASAALPIYGQPEETRRIREAVPVPGRAIVYVYRRHDDAGGPSPVLWLNTAKVGRLLPGSFTAWQVSAGQIEVRAEDIEKTTLSFTSVTGNIYLIRVSVTETPQGPTARFTRVRPDARRSELATLRLLKNPGDIPATLPKEPPPVAPAPPPKPPVAAAPRPPAPKPTPKPEPKAAPAKPPSKFSVILKTGALTLADDTQELFGIDRNFDDQASGLFALEVVHQFRNALTLSGEVIGYSTEFTSSGMSDKHDVDALVAFFNARKYFHTDRRFQPFVGAGIGVASTDVSGPTISGDTSGVAFQVMAGFEFRAKRVGILAELKHISADTEDDDNENVDVSGTGIFFGVRLHF